MLVLKGKLSQHQVSDKPLRIALYDLLLKTLNFNKR